MKVSLFNHLSENISKNQYDGLIDLINEKGKLFVKGFDSIKYIISDGNNIASKISKDNKISHMIHYDSLDKIVKQCDFCIVVVDNSKNMLSKTKELTDQMSRNNIMTFVYSVNSA